MSASSEHPAPAAPTPWRLVLLLGALTAFAPISIDMYLPSLPALQASLGATPGQAQASVAAFFVGMAVGQFIYGPASDRFGRRGPIIIGAAIYVAASIVCMMSTSIEMLILGRLGQALGGCAGGVVSRAVVRDRFNHQDTARILSFLTLIMGLAPIFAPTLGGLMLGLGGWRTIFGVLTFFGVSVGLWAFFGLKESRSEETAAHARSEHVVRSILELFRNPVLVGYALCASLNGALLFTYISASPDLLMGTYGMSPVTFGWVFSVNAAGIIGGSQVNRSFLRRMTADQILARSSLVAAGGGVLLALSAYTGWGGQWSVLGSVFLVLASYGFVQGNTMAGALSADPKRAGSVSAVMGGASFGAGALASTLTGLVHDGTARPLATTALLALLGSTSALYGLVFRAKRKAAA